MSERFLSDRHFEAADRALANVDAPWPTDSNSRLRRAFALAIAEAEQRGVKAGLAAAKDAALKAKNKTCCGAEAADALASAAQAMRDALVQAEGCWLNHYGENPEGAPEPTHIAQMRAWLARYAKEEGDGR